MLLVDEPTKGLAPLLVTEVAAALERVAELTTVLLVEQNLAVVARVAQQVVVLDIGRVVHTRRRAAELLGDPDARARAARRARRHALSTFVLLTITGLGLGAMYFLVASGLSLIYGLMGVLNFAHGALITVGAYATWWMSTQVGGGQATKLLVAAAFGSPSAPCSLPVELVLIRPLYQRPIEQVLVTVGLALALNALVEAIWGFDARPFPVPSWMIDTTSVLGASIPNDRFVEIAAAALVLLGLNAFLRYTRYGLIIRAGVENRAMVTALGIDVRKAFTLVFAIGGAAAALAGVLSGVYFGVVDPGRGHVAAHLRLHRRRHRRLRLDRRHRRRCGRGRADPAVRELLRVERARRPRGGAAARDRAPAQARGARSEGGALKRSLPLLLPVALFAGFALLPLLSLNVPMIFSGPLDSPGTLGLLALCLVFAGVALTYDLLFGFTGLLSFGTRSTSGSAST